MVGIFFFLERLFLNVGIKCKTITFLRSRHLFEFPYMLGQMVLEDVFYGAF
jgi:hypothetical protein